MITDMISTAPGFQTSVNIAYDLNNSEKIKSLIPTSTALSLFEEFLLSLSRRKTLGTTENTGFLGDVVANWLQKCVINLLSE